MQLPSKPYLYASILTERQPVRQRIARIFHFIADRWDVAQVLQFLAAVIGCALVTFLWLCL
jgi:hypothetical protein